MAILASLLNSQTNIVKCTYPVEHQSVHYVPEEPIPFERSNQCYTWIPPKDRLRPQDAKSPRELVRWMVDVITALKGPMPPSIQKVASPQRRGHMTSANCIARPLPGALSDVPMSPNGEPRAVLCLIDFSMEPPPVGFNPSCHSQTISDTLACFSRRVTRSWSQGTLVPREQMDDLESVAWMMLTSVFHNLPAIANSIRLRTHLMEASFGSVAPCSRLIMAKDHIITELSSPRCLREHAPVIQSIAPLFLAWIKISRESWEGEFGDLIMKKDCPAMTEESRAFRIWELTWTAGQLYLEVGEKWLQENENVSWK